MRILLNEVTMILVLIVVLSDVRPPCKFYNRAQPSRTINPIQSKEEKKVHHEFTCLTKISNSDHFFPNLAVAPLMAAIVYINIALLRLQHSIACITSQVHALLMPCIRHEICH